MSYRREDSAVSSSRLHDRLIDAFGDDHVFRDIDDIPAGTDFTSVIVRTLERTDVVVAVIGSRWMPDPGRETDYVRLELAEALRSERPILPVLVGDTPMPQPSGVPEVLQPLLTRSAARVRRDPDFIVMRSGRSARFGV